ncbi:MAG: hypothetical protein HS114_01720 [Anaerolineales bacterium]|nr:hypothetical protein [Anaerolineales bacterium]
MPHPDWFTGVSGLSLLDAQGDWVDSKTVCFTLRCRH